MNAVTVVMTFHSPVGEGFDAWRADLLVAARSANGFRGCATSMRGEHFEAAVAVHFDDESALHAWLDGEARRHVLETGQAQGYWRRAGDLILGDDHATPPGLSAFRHSVATGKEAEFLAIQERLARASSAFSGYEGTAVLAPEIGNEWLSVLRFRTASQLEDWLDSAERDEALPGLRSSLSKGFSAVSSTTPFATTVRVQDGKTLMTPNWKSAMLVLLVLYPTVMTLSRFVGPVVDRAGAEPWLALWISQIFSVSALQWWLMPNVTRPFRGWLDPVDGAGWRTSLIGAAVIVAGYAATLALFASVRWLQFWDYG